MGPRYDQSFCACTTAFLAPEILVSMGPSPHLEFCACKTATLGPDLQVCICPRPLLSFWEHITSCLAQRLYGFQPSPVILFMQNSDFWTRIQVFIGTSPHLSFCACTTAWLSPEWLVSMGPSPHLWFLHAKQRPLEQKYTSLYGS